MKVTIKDDKKFIRFDSEEELQIFCKFFFENDYFIRKTYQTLNAYIFYISTIQNGNLYADCVYHDRLIIELSRMLDKKVERKNKLKKIKHLPEIVPWYQITI